MSPKKSKSEHRRTTIKRIKKGTRRRFRFYSHSPFTSGTNKIGRWWAWKVLDEMGVQCTFFVNDDKLESELERKASVGGALDIFKDGKTFIVVSRGQRPGSPLPPFQAPTLDRIPIAIKERKKAMAKTADTKANFEDAQLKQELKVHYGRELRRDCYEMAFKLVVGNEGFKKCMLNKELDSIMEVVDEIGCHCFLNLVHGWPMEKMAAETAEKKAILKRILSKYDFKNMDYDLLEADLWIPLANAGADASEKITFRIGTQECVEETLMAKDLRTLRLLGDYYRQAK